ncbi:hypothetical protein PtA15_5A486 [Puccinia triticina]|uniref:Uncharacterized protein n=1 Tax=Puccinia triticina TaxID=208348 RepID=A0ABY7CKN1_9BASI|nr:uncharacterized protein PtA15_5A486 [Puccinia triticina]WAQ84913.1 hypothetical protein PtA15_5A486 [Puccinia triticina]
MLRFGIDLFNQEDPPPGCLMRTKQYRICGIGPLPAPGNLAQIISCTTSFKLYYQKTQGKTKPTWKPILSGKKFPFEIMVESMNFDAFQKAVADACDKEFANAEKIIKDALETGFPHLDWLSLNSHCPGDRSQFKKIFAKDPLINNAMSPFSKTGSDALRALTTNFHSSSAHKRVATLAVFYHISEKPDPFIMEQFQILFHGRLLLHEGDLLGHIADVHRWLSPDQK